MASTLEDDLEVADGAEHGHMAGAVQQDGTTQHQSCMNYTGYLFFGAESNSRSLYTKAPTT